MAKIVKIYYNGEVGYDATITQVIEFLKIQQDVDEWLDFTDINNITNRRKIYDGYDFRTLKRLDAVDEDFNELKDESIIESSFPMPWPIELHVDSQNILRDVLINQSNFVSVSDETSDFRDSSTDENNYAFNTTLNQGFARLLNSGDILSVGGNYDSEGSRKVDTGHRVNGSRTDIARKERRNLTVWVWSKTLGNLDTFNPQSVFDLTPFVQSINTNVSEGGGSFSISLAPIIGKLSCEIKDNGESEPTGHWFPDPSTYTKWTSNKVDNYFFKMPINDKYRLPKTYDDFDGKRFQDAKFDGRVNLTDNFNPEDQADEDAYVRSDLFFTNMISENDIIFISFREDKELKEDRIDDFFLSVDNIQNVSWDMIALVDSNSTSFNAESTDISTNISGRDLMKLFIEDGTFFFQKSYSNPDDTETAFNNVDLPNSGDEVNTLNRVVEEESVSGVNRLITTGLIEALFNPEARNVGFIMNLLVSKLANIEICPSQVFESYGDRRTKFQVEVDEPVEQNSDDRLDKLKNEGE